MRLGLISYLVPITMALLATACGDEVQAPSYSPGETTWARRLGRASELEPMAIAGYPGGGVLVAGRYFGEISFGGAVLPSPSNNYQIVLARYDDEGKHVYSKSFGQEASERITDVAMLPDGSALCVGSFSWKVNFGQIELLTQGGDDVFVMKIDPAGKPIWVKQLGGQGPQFARAIVAYPDGSFAIKGTTGGAVDFLEDETQTSALHDFLLRLDKDGNRIWGRSLPDLVGMNSGCLAARPDGGLVIGGRFYESINLGGPGQLVASQYEDGYVAAYDASGKWLWNKTVGGSGYSDEVKAIAVRPNGNVLLTGQVEGSVKWGGVVVGAPGSDSSAFLLELNAEGAYVDSNIFGLSGHDAGNDIALGPDGSVVITGEFDGSLSFGEEILTARGNGDAFVVKFSPDGAVRFQTLFGAADSYEAGNRVALDGKGNVIVSGSVNGEVDFGFGLTRGSGYEETFLVSLAP